MTAHSPSQTWTAEAAPPAPAAAGAPPAPLFAQAAQALTTLSALDAAFAVAIEEEGFFGGHRIVFPTRGAGVPAHPICLAEAGRPGCQRLLVPIERWSAGWTIVELNGHAGPIDRERRARVHLLAAIFVTHRDSLAARSAAAPPRLLS